MAHTSNEIPAVRTLLSALDLTGRVVTLDAMHTQDETARCLVEHCGAHYVMTAVKDNRLDLLRDLAGLDWERPEVRAGEHRSADNGHGRLEKRSCRVFDLTAHTDQARLPNRRVAFRIERERRIRKTGKVEHETVHGLTSLPPEQATAELVLTLVRGHWSIENRLHHVRDVSYDEDRCRVRSAHLPRNLACLTNLAISIVRLKGRFDYLPQALCFAASPTLRHTAPRRRASAPRTSQTLSLRAPHTLRRVLPPPRQRAGSAAARSRPPGAAQYPSAGRKNTLLTLPP